MQSKLSELTAYQPQELQSPITIGIASTPEEKKEIYHFRYQVYVEEMSRQLVSADHRNKMIYDELDKWATLLYAKVGSELIGTIRANTGRLSDFPSDLVKNHSIERFQKFYERKSDEIISFSSKLMVAPHYRNSQTSYLLMAKDYELCCNRQVQFKLAGCNFYLLRFYEQFGAHRYGKNFVLPGYGLLAPVVLIMDDIAHMRAVRSPYFRLARKREITNRQAIDWFYAEFPEVSNNINSQLVTEEALWNILSDRLGDSPDKAIPALYGLSATEASKFLHCCGIVVQCQSGDYISTRNDISNELNILISGKLKTSRFSITSSENIMPGQHFGAIGLVEQPKQENTIISATASEILVISRMAFPKFRHSHPAIAEKILQNLADIASNVNKTQRRIAQ